MLDASEYLHLAIHASQENNHHAALNYLNQALQHEPNNPAIRYFLAAEHAELGLFERACSGMEEALELDPSMDVARFQLGLVYLQLQRTEEARHAFSTLHSLAQEENLKAFADAYLHLLDEKREDAIELFERGLADCENLALKGDMTRVLASLKNVDQPVALETDSEAETPIFLGAYRETLETP
ncbi:tetratricopeptide repeat protein [Pseudomonas anguilliseptica]|uniref:tetratricopeptide repeat protein n=1 Tax=Pseudomonas anguilliseptica TaxID=53406 RepID=UPI0022AF9688|nr:tetratricopeptide repeat protein [Pseudomonas anguilliseptica]MCZ4324661.1 hypothetical protein [Pseudomonas anguilliseptica]